MVSGTPAQRRERIGFLAAIVLGAVIVAATFVVESLPAFAIAFGALIAIGGLIGLWLQRSGGSGGAAGALQRGNSLRRMGPAQLPAAVQAWRTAAAGDDRDVAAQAEFHLGVALNELGDRAGAMDAYRRAVTSGHPLAAPSAAVNLGSLLEDGGDDDAAIAAYGHATRSGHPQQSVIAHLRLGTVLARHDRLDEAEQHADAALTGPPGDHTVPATLLRASLAQRRGDTAQARAIFRRLATSNDPAHARVGETYLALTSLALGEATADDIAALRASAAGGDPNSGSLLGLVEQAMQQDRDNRGHRE